MFWQPLRLLIFENMMLVTQDENFEGHFFYSWNL